MAQAWRGGSEYRTVELGARAETAAHGDMGVSFHHNRSVYHQGGRPWPLYDGSCWELSGEEVLRPASGGRPAPPPPPLPLLCQEFRAVSSSSDGQANLLDAGEVRLARLRCSQRHRAERLLPVPERRRAVDRAPGSQLLEEIDLTKPPPAFHELQYARKAPDCFPTVRVFHAVTQQDQSEHNSLWTPSHDAAPNLLQGGSESRELPSGVGLPQHFAPRLTLPSALRSPWPLRPPLAVQRGFWNRDVGTLEGILSRNVGCSTSPAAGSRIASRAPITRRPPLAKTEVDSMHASSPSVLCVAGYPVTSSHELNGYPVTSTREVNGYPVTSRHEVNGYPVTSRHEVNGYPVTSRHDVNGYPVTSRHDVNGYPVTSAHEVNGYPAASAPEVNGYPVASAHKINGYPRASAHEVNVYPDASAREVNDQSGYPVASAREVWPTAKPRRQSRFEQSSKSYHSASFIRKEHSRPLYNRQSSSDLEMGPLVDSEGRPQEFQCRLAKRKTEKPEERTDCTNRWLPRESKSDYPARREWRAKPNVSKDGDMHFLPSERLTQKQWNKPDTEARVMTRRRYYGRSQPPENFNAAHAQTVDSGSYKKQYNSAIEPNRYVSNDKEQLEILNKTDGDADIKLVSSTKGELSDQLVKIDLQPPLNNDSSENAQVTQIAEEENCINEVQNVGDNTPLTKTFEDEKNNIVKDSFSVTYQQNHDNLNANNATLPLAVKQNTTIDPTVHQTLSNQENEDLTLGFSAPSNHIHETDKDHSRLADPFDTKHAQCQKHERAIDTTASKCLNLKPNSETWNPQNSLTIGPTDKAALSKILKAQDSFRERSKSASSALDSAIADPHVAALRKASRKGSVGSLPQWPPSPVNPPSQTPQRFHSPSFDFIHVPPWPPVSNRLPHHVKLPAKAGTKRSWTDVARPQWPPSPNARFCGQAIDAKAKRGFAAGSRNRPPWPPVSERMPLRHPNPVKTFKASSIAARDTALSPNFMSDPVPKRPKLLGQMEVKSVCRDSSGESLGYSSLPSSPDFHMVQEIQRRLSAKETSQNHPSIEGEPPTLDSRQTAEGQPKRVTQPQGRSPFSDQLSVKQALAFENDEEIQMTSSRHSSPDHQIYHVQSPINLNDQVTVYQLTSSMPSSPDQEVFQEASKLLVTVREQCSQQSDLEAVSKKEVGKEEDHDSGLPALSSGPNLHSDQSRNMDSFYSPGIPRNLPSDISSISNCSSSSSHPRNFHSDHSNVLGNSTSTHHPHAASDKHHRSWNRTCCLDQSCLAEEQNNRGLDQTCILDQRHVFDASLLSDQNSSVKSPSATRPLGGVRTGGQGRLVGPSPNLNSSTSSCLPHSQHSDRNNLTDLSVSFPSVEQSHSTEFSMCRSGQLRLQYSREQLLAISPAVLDPSLQLRLQELDLQGVDNKKKKRKRGCRGGRRLKMRKAAYMAKLGLLQLPPNAEPSEGHQLTTSPDSSYTSSSFTTNSSSSAPPSSACSSFSDDLTCREDVLKALRSEDANSTRGQPSCDAEACPQPGVNDHKANAQIRKSASYQELSDAGCLPLARCPPQPFSAVRGNIVSSIMNPGSKRKRWQDFETSHDDSKPANLTPVPEESSSFFSPAAVASASKNKPSGLRILVDSGKDSLPPLTSCLTASSDHTQKRFTDESLKCDPLPGLTAKTTSEDLISLSEPSNVLNPPFIFVATDVNVSATDATAIISSIEASQPLETASLGSPSLDDCETLRPKTSTLFSTQDSTIFFDYRDNIGLTCESGSKFSRMSDSFSDSQFRNPTEWADSSVEERQNPTRKKTAYFLPFEPNLYPLSIFRFTAASVEIPLLSASLPPHDLNVFQNYSGSKDSLFSRPSDTSPFRGLLSSDSSEARANEERITSSGTDPSQMDSAGEWVWCGPVPAASCDPGVHNPQTQPPPLPLPEIAARGGDDPFAPDFKGSRLQPDDAKLVTGAKSLEIDDETKECDMRLCAPFPVDGMLPAEHFFDQILTSFPVLAPAVLENYPFKPNAPQDRFLLNFELASEGDRESPVCRDSLRRDAAKPLRGHSSNLVFFKTRHFKSRRWQTDVTARSSALLPLMCQSSGYAGDCVSVRPAAFSSRERPRPEVLAVLKGPVHGGGAATVKSILSSSAQNHYPVSSERKWITLDPISSILKNLSAKLPFVQREKSEVAVRAKCKRDYYEPRQTRHRRKAWMCFVLGLAVLCSAVLLILLLVFSQ